MMETIISGTSLYTTLKLTKSPQFPSFQLFNKHKIKLKPWNEAQYLNTRK